MDYSIILTACLILLCKGTVVNGDHCPGGDWKIVNGTCLLFSKQALKWQEAIYECNADQSTLLMFLSSSDRLAFADYIKKNNYTTERWWTSLNDINHPGAWTWNKGETAILSQGNSVVWSVEPDDTHHVENCGALNTQGAVSDEKCSEKHGFICEATITNGHCPKGWILNTNATSCYYLSDLTDAFSLITWSNAKSQCQFLFQDGTGNAHLLYLETIAEQTYIRHQLPSIKQTSQIWWIGMTDQSKEGLWQWTDGSAVHNLNWAVEPNNLAGNENCGMVYNSGRFADENCDQFANYICQAPLVVDVVSEKHFGCPDKWIRGGLKCFLFNITSKQTWSNASIACNSIGARLFEVRNKDDQYWVNYATEDYSGYGFWTGLNYHTDVKTWYWTSGYKADMGIIHWNFEPNDFDGSEDCGMMLQDGTLNDLSCYRSIGFICELQSESAPCPSGWVPSPDEGSFSCYFISSREDNATAKWAEARDLCKTLGAPLDAYLLAVNNQNELSFIQHEILSRPASPKGWWLGLNDIANEGQWLYDTSFNNPPPYDILPWNGEPNNRGGHDYCAMVFYGGRFNDLTCTAKLPFICERYPVNSTNSFVPLNGSKGSRVSGTLINYLVFLVAILFLP